MSKSFAQIGREKISNFSSIRAKQWGALKASHTADMARHSLCIKEPLWESFFLR